MEFERINLVVSMIVAQDRNGVIAVDDQIPWYIPDELSYFAKTTRKKVIVMGRKTCQSLSEHLPNRLNVVMTKNKEFSREGFLTNNNPSSILQYSSPENVFVIGGREIYSLFARYTQRLYITVVDSKQEYSGNAVYFPMEEFKNVRWKCNSHTVDKLYTTMVFERIPSDNNKGKHSN